MEFQRDLTKIQAQLAFRALRIEDACVLALHKFGPDCLFQIISPRCERGAALVTTNRIYKN